MQKLFIFLSVVLVSFSSAGQASLIGKWKPVKVSYVNYIDKTTTTIYDKNNKDSVKRFLLQKYLSQDASDSELVIIDTLEFKNKLDKDFLYYDSSGVILKKDSTFYMESFGLIVPGAEPGWHFGDKLSGKWTLTKNKFLKLTTGNSKISHSFLYKILQQANDHLIIGQTSEDYKTLFNKIEFVRQ